MLCIINNLARNPYKEEWPARAFSHQEAAWSLHLPHKCFPFLQRSPNKDIIISCCPSSSLLTLSSRPPLTGSSKGGMLCKKRFSRGGEAPGALRTSSPTTNEPEIMHHELSTSLPPTKKKYPEISERNFSWGPLNLAIPNMHPCHVEHVDMINNCHWWRRDLQSDDMDWLANDSQSCERLPMWKGGLQQAAVAKYSTQLPPLPVVPHTPRCFQPTIPTQQFLKHLCFPNF